MQTHFTQALPSLAFLIESFIQIIVWTLVLNYYFFVFTILLSGLNLHNKFPIDFYFIWFYENVFQFIFINTFINHNPGFLFLFRVSSFFEVSCSWVVVFHLLPQFLCASTVLIFLFYCFRKIRNKKPNSKMLLRPLRG